MSHEIPLTLMLLGSLGTLVLSLAWLLDLVWICFLSSWATAASAATFMFALLVLFRTTNAACLSTLAAIATVALVVRPLVDLVAWCSDNMPVVFCGAFPFVELEDWSSYRERLKEQAPLRWDYFRDRTRVVQQLKFVAVATSPGE